MSQQEHPNAPQGRGTSNGGRSNGRTASRPSPQAPAGAKAAPTDEEAKVQYLAKQYGLSVPQLNALRATICVDATDAELEVHLITCKRLRFDPFARQCWFVKRLQKVQDENGTSTWQKVGRTETSIDGLRSVAEDSGEYEGQEPLQWYDGESGKWLDVWTLEYPPLAARASVYRKGHRTPMVAVAHWSEYVPTYTKRENGQEVEYVVARWEKAGASQLAKCAEALALRRAFPRTLSGVHTSEELEHLGIDAAAAGASYGAPAAAPAQAALPEKKPDGVAEQVMTKAQAEAVVEKAITMITQSTTMRELQAVQAVSKPYENSKDPASVWIVSSIRKLYDERALLLRGQR